MFTPRFRLRQTATHLDWVLPAWFLLLRLHVAVLSVAAALYSGQPLGAPGWFVLSFVLVSAAYHERWRWYREARTLEHVWGLWPFWSRREQHDLSEDSRLLLEALGRGAVLRLLGPSGSVGLDRCGSPSGRQRLRELGESTARALGLGFVVQEARDLTPR